MAAHVRLHIADSSGATQAQRNQRIQEKLNHPELSPSMRAALTKKIEADKLPALNSYEHWVLQRFWELHSGRGSGPHGPAPLSFNDIISFCEVMGEELEPIEAQVLKAVDGAYLDAVFTEQQNSRE